jgi:hypothetical protein
VLCGPAIKLLDHRRVHAHDNLPAQTAAMPAAFQWQVVALSMRDGVASRTGQLRARHDLPRWVSAATTPGVNDTLAGASLNKTPWRWEFVGVAQQRHPAD